MAMFAVTILTVLSMWVTSREAERHDHAMRAWLWLAAVSGATALIILRLFSALQKRAHS